MTTEPTDTHSSSHATEPLALRLSEGLGPCWRNEMMLTDKEVLLKAARAAGYGLNARGQSLRETEMPNEPALWLTHATWWNPLTDSGQALDLAVTLEMDIGQMLTEGCVTVTGVAFDGEALAHDVPWGTDPTAATRRAIVLVAADMAN